MRKGARMSRAASASATRGDTPSSRKDCIFGFDSFVFGRDPPASSACAITGVTEEEQTSQDDTTPSVSNKVAAGALDSLRRMISFARGAPAPECLDADLLADCARVAIETDPSVLAYGSGGGYAPLRESLGARHRVDPGRVLLTTGGLQGFVFYAEELLGSRPGRVAGRGADLRSPAEDPRATGRRRRGAPDGRRRTRPGRARARARRRRDELSLHDPDLPESEWPHSLDRAASPSRRARGRTRCPGARGRPVRPRPLRRRSTAVAVRPGGRARSSRTPPPSRRPSRRGCVSAGSSRPQSSPPGSKRGRCPPTSRLRS